MSDLQQSFQRINCKAVCYYTLKLIAVESVYLSCISLRVKQTFLGSIWLRVYCVCVCVRLCVYVCVCVLLVVQMVLACSLMYLALYQWVCTHWVSNLEEVSLVFQHFIWLSMQSLPWTYFKEIFMYDLKRKSVLYIPQDEEITESLL